MAETKKKDLREKTSKPTNKMVVPGERNANQAERKDLRDFWQEEIEALQQGSFSSIDQAIEVLVDRVLERMKSDKHGIQGEREFVIDFLKTDAEIVEELQRILQLK